MATPSENLNRLSVALHAGKPVPDEVATWLLRGLSLYRSGASLERVLGLSSGTAAERRAERDKWICEAAMIVFMRYGDWSESDVANYLAAEIRKIYSSVAWRNRRNGGFHEIDDDTQSVSGCLKNAFSCVAKLDSNSPVPTSPRQILRVIIENETLQE